MFRCCATIVAAGEQLLFPDHEDDPTNLRDQQQQPGVLTVEHWYSKHSPHQHEQQQQQQRHAQRPEPSAAVGAARPRVRQVSPNRLPLSSSTSSSSWEDVGGPGAVQKHPDEAAEDVRGRSKPRKRSIAGDICWMLQIRTFQVGSTATCDVGNSECACGRALLPVRVVLGTLVVLQQHGSFYALRWLPSPVWDDSKAYVIVGAGRALAV